MYSSISTKKCVGQALDSCFCCLKIQIENVHDKRMGSIISNFNPDLMNQAAAVNSDVLCSLVRFLLFLTACCFALFAVLLLLGSLLRKESRL